MRNTWRQLKGWMRERWLELVMVAGLVGIGAWFASVGYSFVPKPAPTQTPAPAVTQTPALPVRPTRAPLLQATHTPRPTATRAVTPTPEPVVTAEVETFDGARAYQSVLEQMKFGPHPTGSEANLKLGDYIAAELRKAGWQVEFQDFVYKDTKARNIIGRAGQGPVAIVGAHYDSRKYADQDPDPAKRTLPMPAANDGASGVALLLELARSLDKTRLSNEVWLTFFDAEDNGGIDGWDYLAGSRYMAQQLDVNPAFMVLADMIGDQDQQIYEERTSSQQLVDRIWAIAKQLNYDEYFRPEYKWSMEDDHTPFIEKGIPAADVIDFDYPYWHTTQDTADKVSAAALEHVGRVFQAFLEGNN
jgi:hypothetical protein